MKRSFNSLMSQYKSEKYKKQTSASSWRTNRASTGQNTWRTTTTADRNIYNNRRDFSGAQSEQRGYQPKEGDLISSKTSKVEKVLEKINAIERFDPLTDSNSLSTRNNVLMELSTAIQELGATQFSKHSQVAREVSAAIGLIGSIKPQYLSPLDYAAISRFITRASFQKQLELSEIGTVGVYQVLMAFLSTNGTAFRNREASNNVIGPKINSNYDSRGLSGNTGFHIVTSGGIPVIHEVIRGMAQLLMVGGRHLSKYRHDTLTMMIHLCEMFDGDKRDDNVTHACIDAMGNFFESSYTPACIAVDGLGKETVEVLEDLRNMRSIHGKCTAIVLSAFQRSTRALFGKDHIVAYGASSHVEPFLSGSGSGTNTRKNYNNIDWNGPVWKTLVSSSRALAQLMSPAVSPQSENSSTNNNNHNNNNNNNNKMTSVKLEFRSMYRLLGRQHFSTLINCTIVIMDSFLKRGISSFSHLDQTPRMISDGSGGVQWGVQYAGVPSTTGNWDTPPQSATVEIKVWTQVLRLIGYLAAYYPTDVASYWDHFLKDTGTVESKLTNYILTLDYVDTAEQIRTKFKDVSSEFNSELDQIQEDLNWQRGGGQQADWRLSSSATPGLRPPGLSPPGLISQPIHNASTTRMYQTYVAYNAHGEPPPDLHYETPIFAALLHHPNPSLRITACQCLSGFIRNLNLENWLSTPHKSGAANTMTGSWAGSMSDKILAGVCKIIRILILAIRTEKDRLVYPEVLELASTIIENIPLLEAEPLEEEDVSLQMPYKPTGPKKSNEGLEQLCYIMTRSILERLVADSAFNAALLNFRDEEAFDDANGTAALTWLTHICKTINPHSCLLRAINSLAFPVCDELKYTRAYHRLAKIASTAEKNGKSNWRKPSTITNYDAFNEVASTYESGALALDDFHEIDIHIAISCGGSHSSATESSAGFVVCGFIPALGVLTTRSNAVNQANPHASYCRALLFEVVRAYFLKFSVDTKWIFAFTESLRDSSSSIQRILAAKLTASMLTMNLQDKDPDVLHRIKYQGDFVESPWKVVADKTASSAVDHSTAYSIPIDEICRYLIKMSYDSDHQVRSSAVAAIGNFTVNHWILLHERSAIDIVIDREILELTMDEHDDTVMDKIGAYMNSNGLTLANQAVIALIRGCSDRVGTIRMAALKSLGDSLALGALICTSSHVQTSIKSGVTPLETAQDTTESGDLVRDVLKAILTGCRDSKLGSRVQATWGLGNILLLIAPLRQQYIYRAFEGDDSTVLESLPWMRETEWRAMLELSYNLTSDSDKLLASVVRALGILSLGLSPWDLTHHALLESVLHVLVDKILLSDKLSKKDLSNFVLSDFRSGEDIGLGPVTIAPARGQASVGVIGSGNTTDVIGSEREVGVIGPGAIGGERLDGGDAGTPATLDINNHFSPYKKFYIEANSSTITQTKEKDSITIPLSPNYGQVGVPANLETAAAEAEKAAIAQKITNSRYQLNAYNDSEFTSAFQFHNVIEDVLGDGIPAGGRGNANSLPLRAPNNLLNVTTFTSYKNPQDTIAPEDDWLGWRRHVERASAAVTPKLVFSVCQAVGLIGWIFSCRYNRGHYDARLGVDSVKGNDSPGLYSVASKIKFKFLEKNAKSTEFDKETEEKVNMWLERLKSILCALLRHSRPKVQLQATKALISLTHTRGSINDADILEGVLITSTYYAYTRKYHTIELKKTKLITSKNSALDSDLAYNPIDLERALMVLLWVLLSRMKDNFGEHLKRTTLHHLDGMIDWLDGCVEREPRPILTSELSITAPPLMNTTPDLRFGDNIHPREIAKEIVHLVCELLNLDIDNNYTQNSVTSATTSGTLTRLKSILESKASIDGGTVSNNAQSMVEGDLDSEDEL